MSKLQQDQPATVDYPEFRAACLDEVEAVARAHNIRDRLPRAIADVRLRKQDRDALAGRAAWGEEVTGADVRKAEEAIQDAEGTVQLLREALPKAHNAAHDAARVRSDAEVPIHAAIRQPFKDARDAARQALTLAQAAFDKAEAEADNLPDHARTRLQEVLTAHGFDPAAGAYVQRVQDVIRHNTALKSDGRPEQELP